MVGLTTKFNASIENLFIYNLIKIFGADLPENTVLSDKFSLNNNNIAFRNCWPIYPRKILLSYGTVAIPFFINNRE